MNPFNIIIAGKKTNLVDVENVYTGDYLTDAANFFSHLETLEDLGLTGNERRASQATFLKSYEETHGKLSPEEKKRFKTYAAYFKLLATTHQMVWGSK